jgi:hypothetical protein
MLRIIQTVLSFGLNILIEKLKLDPRWNRVIIGLIVLNEIRGIIVVWQFGGAALKLV